MTLRLLSLSLNGNLRNRQSHKCVKRQKEQHVQTLEAKEGKSLRVNGNETGSRSPGRGPCKNNEEF